LFSNNSEHCVARADMQAISYRDVRFDLEFPQGTSLHGASGCWLFYLAQFR